MRAKFLRKLRATGPKLFRDFEPHFEELRRRFLFSFWAFLAATIVSYFFSSQLLNLLTQPLKTYDPQVSLFFQKPYEAFLTHIKIACTAGFVISCPVIFSQAWSFLTPGLYDREKKMILPLILTTTALFLFGVWFGYRWVIPWGIHFLLSYQTEMMKPLLGVGPYFSFLISMLLAFGILFDFPVVIIGLVKLGIVETQTLASMRKGIILTIFIVAAVLTPSPDPVSQLLLAIPLWILFELSLLIAGVIERKRKIA